MSALPTSSGLQFAPNWAALAQIFGSAIAAPNGRFAAGAAQGAQNYQAMQDARLNQQYREEQLRMQQEEAQQRREAAQRAQQQDQQWQDIFMPRTAVAGIKPNEIQTASAQNPMGDFVAQLSPEKRAMLSLAGREAGMPMLLDWMGPGKDDRTNTIKEYEYAKSQGFQGSFFDFEKAKAEAGRAPQQPAATNLVTLVAPDGKTTRSFDSRDPQVAALAAQGWIERQTSMFPAAPSGYTYTPSGLAPIPGGPADPANPNNITGDQRKTGSFATRLETASGIIDKYESAGTDYIEAGKGLIPVFGNMLKTSDRQQLEQAQRDFINAQLRRESGATIQDVEFENARQQYFPQPGDSDAVIKQKSAARKIAVENMKREAGAALQSNGGDEWTVVDGVKIRKKN